MTFKDALRKVQLLRKIKPENGASDGEVENAAHLAGVLMERFSIPVEDARHVPPPPTRLTWIYWELLLSEFGVDLSRFGRRGTASLGGGKFVFVRLDTGRWWIRQSSAVGLETIALDAGLESLRAYLAENGPRSYSLAATVR